MSVIIPTGLRQEVEARRPDAPAQPSAPPSHAGQADGERRQGSLWSGGEIHLTDLVRAAAGLMLFVWAWMIWSGVPVVPGAALVTIVYSVIGVVATGVAFLPIAHRRRRWLDGTVLVLVLVAFAFWLHGQVYMSPGYGADELALNQGAAQTLLHGTNPYGADLGWTLDHFQLPASLHTYRLDGSEVTRVTYPALSFLIYVPALLLGIDAQAAVYVDALLWAAAMVVLWFCLPWRMRPLVPVLASLTIYVTYVQGGVTDAAYLPLTLLAFYRWDRFGERGAGLVRWTGPVLLGLACSIKQVPWFFVPFLLIAVAVEGRAAGRRVWRRPLAYATLWASGFLLPNLPFIILDPHRWFSGVIAPLADHLVPFGQAFVAISLQLGHGTGHLDDYTLAALGVLMALALALIRWYPSCKKVIPLFPAIIFLFPTRSLTSYFIYELPVLLICASSVRPAAAGPLWHRRRGMVSGRLCAYACAVLAAGAVGCVIAGALSRPPLLISVVNVHATGNLSSFDEVTVRVTNLTDRSVTPHFSVSNGVYMSTPWLRTRGLAALPPGGHGDYQLAAPNVPSMPSINVCFRVYATTVVPATVSASDVVAPSLYHTQIIPQAVNRVIGKDEAVDLDVRVLDHLGQEVHEAGIPVDLGQIVYAQEGIFSGELSIDGHAEGETPVMGLTDSDGVVHFQVRAVQTQPYEVFVEALLPEGYPKGFSNTVGLRFQYP